MLAAEYDPARAHGQVDWRAHDRVPVAEIVNNWVCQSFEETYRPPLIGDRIASVLRAVQPDIVHVHNLMNLSFDLPALARRAGARVVATLHDYTLVCASGGQRLHRADQHICRTIDVDRCARCFGESPFASQMTVGATAQLLQRAALAMRRRAPGLAARAARVVTSAAPAARISPREIAARLGAARAAYQDIDLFVSPSAFLASEFRDLGVPPAKLLVSDNGFRVIERPIARPPRDPDAPLRIGYVGTIVWHKGVHVLLDAVRALPAGKWKLQIFGNEATFPDYAASLRQQARGLPVVFAGAFNGEAVASIYEQIDVLVVPSIWLENSPLVIHEAFMAGVPVVAARIGGIAGLIADGVSGLLFDAGSSSALAQALRSLIDSPATLQALASRLPAVKSIDVDARDWDTRYASVLALREEKITR